VAGPRAGPTGGGNRPGWLAAAPLRCCRVAARAVAVARAVGCTALRATPVRLDSRVGGFEPGDEEAPPPWLVRVSKHRLPPWSRWDSATRPAQSQVPGQSTRGQCGRLSGCHASPNTPAGLADGFGDGSHLRGKAPIHPMSWVPRPVFPPVRPLFSTTRSGACALTARKFDEFEIPATGTAPRPIGPSGCARWHLQATGPPAGWSGSAAVSTLRWESNPCRRSPLRPPLPAAPWPGR